MNFYFVYDIIKRLDVLTFLFHFFRVYFFRDFTDFLHVLILDLNDRRVTFHVKWNAIVGFNLQKVDRLERVQLIIHLHFIQVEVPLLLLSKGHHVDSIFRHSYEVLGLTDEEPHNLALPKLKGLGLEYDPLDLVASKVRNVDDDHTESVDIDRFETHNQLFEVALVISHHWDTGISYFQVIFHFKQELLVIVCGIILIESDQVDSKSFLVLVWKNVESLVV